MYVNRSMVVGILLVPLAFGLGGCTPGAAEDGVLGALLSQIDPNTSLGEVLDQLTVGDLIAGFQSFNRDLSGEGGFAAGGPDLSDEQLESIREFQAQFSGGQIGRPELGSLVNQTVGDHMPHHAFAGFQFRGGPMGGAPRGRLADELGLTEEQQARADEIFEQLHADIRVLRDAIHADIQAVLTEEQLEALDDTSRALFARRGGPRAPRAAGGNPLSERLTGDLALSEEQEASIAELRDELRGTIRDRHMQARQEFHDILTDEQIVMLDEIESRFDDRFESQEEDESDG